MVAGGWGVGVVGVGYSGCRGQGTWKGRKRGGGGGGGRPKGGGAGGRVREGPGPRPFSGRVSIEAGGVWGSGWAAGGVGEENWVLFRGRRLLGYRGVRWRGHRGLVRRVLVRFDPPFGYPPRDLKEGWAGWVRQFESEKSGEGRRAVGGENNIRGENMGRAAGGGGGLAPGFGRAVVRGGAGRVRDSRVCWVCLGAVSGKRPV